MEIALAILLLFFVYLIVDNNNLWITKQNLFFDTLPEEFDGVKIIQLADLHTKTFGKNNKRLIKAVKNQSPNYILLCGDMVSRDCTNFSPIENLLCNLAEICPVYYSLGNHEIDMSAHMKSELFTAIKRANVTLLNNETNTIKKGKSSIRIVGASLLRENYRCKTAGYKKLRGYDLSDLDNAIGSKQGFTILLAHNPFFAQTYFKWGADLILSGHVHGGVIRLPFIGGLLSPERKFFPKYSKGIYNRSSSSMSVSRGLGKLRIFNPPEIVLIEMNKTNDET